MPVIRFICSSQAVLYKVDAVLLPPSTLPLIAGINLAGGGNVTLLQALQGRPVSGRV